MRTSVIRSPAVLLLVAMASACGEHDNPLRPEARDIETPSPDRTIEVVSRSASIPTFPCVEQCHAERVSDATPRELTAFHTTIELDHAPVMAFCDSCHDLENMDRFHLVNGTPVDFDDLDYLCGQCHGEKHRDWSRGIHGIQTGSWRTTIRRRACTACHDPHDPLDGIHLEALPVPADVRGEEGED